MKFVTNTQVIGNVLRVVFNDGEVKIYDAVKLGCEWFKMSNDAFFEKYGFNFVPRGSLYEVCKFKVQTGDDI